jgi:hypothetical protein
MKKTTIWLMLAVLGCQKPFRLDDAREYTPSELIGTLPRTPCRQAAAWENREVLVRGTLDWQGLAAERGQFTVFDPGAPYGTGGRLMVRFDEADPAERAALENRLRQHGGATGVLLRAHLESVEMQTQLACRRSPSLRLQAASQLTLR